MEMQEVPTEGERQEQDEGAGEQIEEAKPEGTENLTSSGL